MLITARKAAERPAAMTSRFANIQIASAADYRLNNSGSLAIFAAILQPLIFR
jgi:hypothetical protein